MSLDRTDTEILEELRKDGRASFSDIGEKLGLATSTVSSRVAMLQENGILENFRPVINYEKLGFDLSAMIDIRADSERIPDLADDLKDNERVMSFFEVTGETDMILVTRFEDREGMNSFLKELQSIKGIQSTETHVILTEPKLEDNMDLEKVL